MNAAPSEPSLNTSYVELWHRVGIALLIFTATLLVAYWVLWFADRGIVASEHTTQYIAFEQAVPLADGWLVLTALAAAMQLWRRRPNALMWLCMFGGAGLYLCALDVLYNLEHGVYTMGRGGASELGLNIATAAMSIGTLIVSWHFRRDVLGKLGDVT